MSTLTPMNKQRHADIRAVLIDEVRATTGAQRGGEPGAGSASEHSAAGRNRRGVTWLLPAAAVVIGAAALPWVLGDDANVSWSAVPDAVLPAEAQGHAAACRDWVADVMGQSQAPAYAGVDYSALSQRVVERRGAFTLSVLASSGLTVNCLEQTNGNQETLSAGVSLNDPDVVPAAESVSVVMHDISSHASMSDVEESGRPATEHREVLVGTAGVEVRSVVIHVPNYEPIYSTLTEDGYWTAWWPGADSTPRPDTISLSLSLESGDTVDVTLTDVLVPPAEGPKDDASTTTATP